MNEMALLEHINALQATELRRQIKKEKFVECAFVVEQRREAPLFMLRKRMIETQRPREKEEKKESLDRTYIQLLLV